MSGGNTIQIDVTDTDDNFIEHNEFYHSLLDFSIRIAHDTKSL